MMTWRRSVRIAISLCAATLGLAALSAPVTLPAAQRDPNAIFAPPKSATTGFELTPGSTLFITREGTIPNQCSLGFIVTDSTGKNFGVTAGHCVDHDGQPTVFRSDPLGHTITSHTFLDYAVTTIERDVQIVSRYQSYHSPGWSDEMCKWGARTGYTCGKVSASALGYFASDTLVLPGDSGGPSQSTDGATLYGISSFNFFFPRRYSPSAFLSAGAIMDSLNAGETPGVTAPVHLIGTELA